MPNQESIRHKLVDEFSTTQPILETLLTELRKVSKKVDSISNHLDEQDKKLATLTAQTILAGNMANESLKLGHENKAIIHSIDQSLLGAIELAKSGYDIATALKSFRDTEPPPSDDSEIEIEYDDESDTGTARRKFKVIAGTGT